MDTKSKQLDLERIQTVFSLIQPTGTMHLGNYLGAVSSWAGIIQIKLMIPRVDFWMADLLVQQAPKKLRISLIIKWIH